MNVKRIILFFAAALGILTSCVENLNEPNDVNNLLSGVEAQVEAMQKSAEDMKALNEALGECGVDVADAEKAISQHLASIKKGASLETATLATLELQKKIAAVVGAAEGAVLFEEGYAKNFKKLFVDANSGIAMWLGESFSAYYQVAVAQAKIDFVLGDLNPQIEDQQMYVDAIMSDIEAGLRKDENPAEITELAASVKKMSQESEDLASGLASLAEELEAEYKSAITANSDFDSETLIELNKTALTKAGSATPTLVELAAAIVKCQADIEELTERLGEVEAEIGELITMIQSLTFVSEYSDDKAVAYYSMTNQVNDERSSEGKMNRVPEETFNLTFLVRPAAAADALAQTWQESLSVVGYYANRIQQQATVNIQSFDITDAVATHGKGLITVTVNNAFDDEFYFKEKGAMLALSVESGKNNCASKFVEIVPRDISGKVYAESIKLTPETLSIQDGDTYKFSPVVSPANVTDLGFTWNTFGTDYFTVDENGKLTAEKVGTSPVEVTAKATDEWGRTLTATCDVTVTPAIEINGPGYVEVGHTINLTLESPNTIYPGDVKWNIVLDVYADDASNYVTWTKNESTGGLEIVGVQACYNDVAKEYHKFDVICTIGQANPVVVQKELRVVYAQPNRVSLRNGLPNDAEEVTIKIGQTYDLAADILPVEAQQSGFFRCKYESNAEYYVSCGIANYEGLVTAVAVGTAPMKIRVLNYTSFDYYYPKGGEYCRHLDINVEPYWVTGLSLTAPDEIDIDVPNKIIPVFVSDVQGKDPTNQNLTWESLTEEVADVDQDGNITGKKEGTAIIRATTDASSTENKVPIEATCTLTVVKPGVEVVVGEYYFSDGTWGSRSDPKNAGKTAIGVIFAKVNASALDSHLGTDHSDCTHGLAIGLNQLSATTYANGNSSASRKTPANWLFNNGYYNHDISKVCGYGNTKGILDLPDSDNAFGISVCDGLSSYYPSAPGISSGWYVPSYKEMQMITDVIESVNNAITSAGGTRLSNDLYWSSSLRTIWWKDTVATGYLDYMYCTPFSISKNTWNDTSGSTDSNSYPVRVVLAF